MNIDRQISECVRNERVDAYSLVHRRDVAYAIVTLQQHRRDSEKIKMLRNEGIIAYPGIHPNAIQEIQNFCIEQHVYNGHRICYSDGIPRKLTDDYAYPFGSLTLESVIRCPHLFEFATHPAAIETARDYLGCIPTLYSLHAWWSVAGHPAPYTQVVHRDYDDFKFVSLICYLTDVTMENGPHVFWPGTHIQDSMEGIKPLVLTGLAGTAFMADTYAYHQGMPLKKGRRLAFWARYGLYKNWVYDNDRAGRVQRSLVDGRIVWTEENRYITRLLWEDENKEG